MIMYSQADKNSLDTTPAVSVCQRHAFTLLELIVVVVIVSIMAVSLYSVFQTGLISYKKAEKTFDMYQSVRMVFDTIEKDLVNSFAYAKDDARFFGLAHELHFFSISSVYKERRLHNVTSRIRYTLEGEGLRRTLQCGLAALAQEANGQEGILAFHVQDIAFQYAAASATQDAYEWQDNWPKDETQKNKRPLAVKVTLTLVDKEKNKSIPVSFTSICGIP